MESRRGAIGAWVIAGIPLGVLLVQAVIAEFINGDTAGAAAGVYGASTAAGTDGILVAGLCLLAVLGWIGLGLTTFVVGNRELGSAMGIGTAVVVLLFGLSAVTGGSDIAGIEIALAATVVVVTVGGVIGTVGLLPQQSGRQQTNTLSTAFVDPTEGEREASAPDTSSQVTEPIHDANQPGRERHDTTPSTAHSHDISQSTLDRIERVAPEAVAQVEQGDSLKDAETVLYRGIEDAIAKGQFDMSVTSTYGQPYEIVNLPTRFRELSIPATDGSCHVSKTEQQLQSWIDDATIPLRDVAYAVEAMADHRNEISQFIEDHEATFADQATEIEATLSTTQRLTDQIAGSVGERLRMLVLESRHMEVNGASEISAGIEAAKSDLHRCSFDQAIHQLETLATDADQLLTAVEFFRSLVGGIEHGQQSASIPNETAQRLFEELEGLLEQQYGVSLTLRDGEVVLESTRGQPEPSTSSWSPGQENSEPTGRTDAGASQVEPAAVADEILFVLRELGREQASGSIVEYQTEQLPDSVADPGVFDELVTFCQRQPDIVEHATVQSGAPPGFLEIEFNEQTTVAAGTSELVDRFVDRYSSADQ